MVVDRPQVLGGVGPPWPPGARQRGQIDDAEAFRGAAHPEVGDGEGVRIAEGTHRDHLHRPGADAAQGRQPRPCLVALGAGRQVHPARGQRLSQTRQGRLPGRGEGERARRQVHQRPRLREQMGQSAADRIGNRLTEALHQPGRVGARRRRGDLLPQHGAERELVAVHGARHPASRRPRHERGQHRVGREGVVHGDRVGVQVEEAAAATQGGGQIARVAEVKPGRHVIGARGQGDEAGTVRQPQRAAVGAVTPLLDAGHRGRSEMPKNVGRVEGGPERQPQPQLQQTGVGVSALARPPSKRRGGGRIDLRDGVVEGADRTEPRGEGHLGQRQGGGGQQNAGGVGALHASQAQRGGAQLVEGEALHLTHGVAQPGRQTVDALAVDDPVPDEPHGACGDVGAGVPFG